MHFDIHFLAVYDIFMLLTKMLEHLHVENFYKYTFININIHFYQLHFINTIVMITAKFENIQGPAV